MPSTTTHLATLAKQVDGNIQFIYPKTMATIVDYSPDDDPTHITSVQTHLRAIDSDISDMKAADGTLEDQFNNYYDKDDIADIFYTPVVINSLSLGVTTAKVGSSGTTTATINVTRFTKISSITLSATGNNSVGQPSNPDNDPNIGNLTYSTSASVNYSSDSSATTITVTATVKDTATSQHAQTTATKTATITFRWPAFYATSTGTTAPTTGLTERYTSSNSVGSGTFTISGLSNHYIYYYTKSSITPATQIKTTAGFAAGFIANGTATITVNGLTGISYYVYRTQNTMDGSVTLVVSA